MIILISHEAQSRSCCWLHAINLRPFIWWSLLVAEITTFHFRPYINDRINQKSSLTRSILIQWNRNGVFLATSSSINEYKGCPFYPLNMQFRSLESRKRDKALKICISEIISHQVYVYSFIFDWLLLNWNDKRMPSIIEFGAGPLHLRIRPNASIWKAEIQLCLGFFQGHFVVSGILQFQNSIQCPSKPDSVAYGTKDQTFISKSPEHVYCLSVLYWNL